MKDVSGVICCPTLKWLTGWELFILKSYRYCLWCSRNTRSAKWSRRGACAFQRESMMPPSGLSCLTTTASELEADWLNWSQAINSPVTHLYRWIIKYLEALIWIWQHFWLGDPVLEAQGSCSLGFGYNSRTAALRLQRFACAHLCDYTHCENILFSSWMSLDTSPLKRKQTVSYYEYLQNSSKQL